MKKDADIWAEEAKVWVIRRNTDLTEGRGAVKPWKAFVSKAKAEEEVLTAGVQGGRAQGPDEMSGIIIWFRDGDTVFCPYDASLKCDTTPPTDEELVEAKRSGLDKLTPLERFALGLDS